MSMKELDLIKVLERIIKQEISQREASGILNLSTRQIRRLQHRYNKEGATGICSKKRGRQGNHRIPDATKQKALELILQRYSDFGPTLAHEKLTECHYVKISLSVVRNIMKENHIWFPKRVKKIIIHPSRERRSCIGQLIQFDGSTHIWFGDVKCTLLVFIDDATSQLMLLRFIPVENLWDYFKTMQDYIEKYGRPVEVYCDRHASLRNRKPNLLETKGMTQFQRAMSELNIKLIHAHSPQGKGRVERANRTLQDRLIKEMSLKGISSMEAANAFLEGFTEDYNKRFAKEPKSPFNAHRSIEENMKLEEIFSWHEERTVTKNLMIQYDNKHYVIIAENRMQASLRRAKVTVLETVRGEIKIKYKGKELPFRLYGEMSYRDPEHDEAMRESAAERWVKQEYSRKRGNPAWCERFKIKRVG